MTLILFSLMSIPKIFLLQYVVGLLRFHLFDSAAYDGKVIKLPLILIFQDQE